LGEAIWGISVEKSVERDNFLSAEEAKEFGIIDEVITSRPPADDDADAAAKDE
jgi:ATP-dependent Clp protease protease subunit